METKRKRLETPALTHDLASLRVLRLFQALAQGRKIDAIKALRDLVPIQPHYFHDRECGGQDGDECVYTTCLGLVEVKEAIDLVLPPKK